MEFKEIVSQDYPENKQVIFQYTSDFMYNVKILKKSQNQGWMFDWTLQKLEEPFKKKDEDPLFNDYKEGAHYYIVLNDKGDEVAIFSFGIQKWNNLTRVYDIYVNPYYQRQGLGSQIFDFIDNQAKSMNTRGIILECQNTNYPAISFYLAKGCDLIGFDLGAYSGEKIDPREKRLEMAKFF
jgi:GNAT superfamily N-acetyltransferase